MARHRSLVRFTVATAAAALVVAAGCASTTTEASDRSIAAVQSPVTTLPAAKPSPPETCPASLRPQGVPPAPLQMPAGSYMADIQNHGALRVGVDQNTLFFGYRNPATNELQGFDIDVAKLIAQAIFGDPNRIEYVVVSTSQRIPAVAG